MFEYGIVSFLFHGRIYWIQYSIRYHNAESFSCVELPSNFYLCVLWTQRNKAKQNPVHESTFLWLWLELVNLISLYFQLCENLQGNLAPILPSDVHAQLMLPLFYLLNTTKNLAHKFLRLISCSGYWYFLNLFEFWRLSAHESRVQSDIIDATVTPPLYNAEELPCIWFLYS